MATYLTRTQGTPTGRTKQTISIWCKRSSVSSINNPLFGGGDTVNRYAFLNLNPSDKLFIQSATNDVADFGLTSVQVFRDVNAWYHIVVEVDTTQATSTDRIKVYVNGSQISFTGTYPSQNYEMQWNFSGDTQQVGRYPAGTALEFYGLMAHYHYCDGYAYTASAFGETDATSGVWKPKTAPSVTYGTNGFFLKFANSASLGTDSSGNGNNFTVNGSATQTLDTPSNVYATLNPLLQSGVGTFTNGNLTHSSSSGVKHTVSTLGMTTGKWYAEAKYIGGANYNGVGFVTEPIFATTSAWYASPYNATLTYTNVYNNSTSYGSFATPSTGDIIGMAIDLDNGYMYWSNNGVWGNSGVPTSGATGTGGIATSLIGTLGSSTFFFATEQDATPGTRTADWNFGNGYFGTTVIASPNSDGAGEGKFAYAPPTGYYALNTKNIKTYG